MKLREIKQWPKIWGIVEKYAKDFLKEEYTEDEELCHVFAWSSTPYTDLFVCLDSDVYRAKREFPKMFTKIIHELWT